MPLTYEGNEREHVQLVILKLSDMDPDELKHNLEAARIAYRDVLAWSEHPDQVETGASDFNSPPYVIKQIKEWDRDQNLKWL